MAWGPDRKLSPEALGPGGAPSAVRPTMLRAQPACGRRGRSQKVVGVRTRCSKFPGSSAASRPPAGEPPPIRGRGGTARLRGPEAWSGRPAGSPGFSAYPNFGFLVTALELTIEAFTSPLSFGRGRTTPALAALTNVTPPLSVLKKDSLADEGYKSNRPPGTKLLPFPK